ncbi:MAG: helix-turn-helix transcriptional regulator [Pseudomonadales bacterium]|nr:helix-turn-helix transcriptional regulator [Pseudomonadales bacterium]
MQTGEILKKLMETQAISQYGLSLETEINQSTISGILRGRSKSPSDEVLTPIARFFEISLAQLRGYEPIADFGDENSHDNRILRNFIPCFRLEQNANDHQAFNRWLSKDLQKNQAPLLAATCGASSESTFATWVPDDGMAPSLPIGIPVFICTDEINAGPSSGGRIVLIRKGNVYAIREETITIDGTVYRPLNDQFEIHSDTEIEILGWFSGTPETYTIGSLNPEPQIYPYEEAYAIGAGWLDTSY